MLDLIQDLRFGSRMLAKSPGVTITAILTLAIGISAASTIFSWINATILDPIPGVARTSDMVTLMRGEPNINPTPPFSSLDLQDLSAKTTSFAHLVGYHDDWVMLTNSGRPERAYAALATANYFEAMGVRPIVGRTFLPSEGTTPGGAPVVVIGFGLWQSYFAGSPAILDKTLEINHRPYTVIGVAPRDFQGCKTGLRTELWIPIVMDREVWRSDRATRRGTFWLNVIGRLRPGVSRQQAEDETNRLMQAIVAQYPLDHKGPNQITIDPLWRSPFGANVYLYKTLPILLGIACLVLLLACANVANLLLLRALGRRKEIAIRLSMGASRWRVVRQFLAEGLLLALLSGAVAAGITVWTAEMLAGFVPPSGSPITLNGRLDTTVLAATLVMSILTSFVFGIVPALRTSKVPPATVLNEETGRVAGGTHKAGLASALVVAQISLSLVLLLCAGLFVRSLLEIQAADAGFQRDGVVLASYDLAPAGYSAANGRAFHRQLLDRLRTMPGVESAALSDWVPLTFTKRTEEIAPEGYVPRVRESLDLRRAVVSPDYFRTMRIAMVAGRDFTSQDTDTSPRVAIVNQALAGRYWPGQDALGKRIRLRDQWFTVVGLTRDTSQQRLSDRPEPMLYLSVLQAYRADAIIHARVAGDATAFAGQLRKTIAQLDPGLTVWSVTTLASTTRLSSIFERLAASFVGAFGILALILAAVGIYGVVAHSTQLRTREIGIRVALGASRADVFRLVTGHGLRLAAIGIAVGLVLALAVSRALRGLLFGIGETDLLTFAGVSVMLGLVALAACSIPAWRIIRREPLDALRDR